MEPPARRAVEDIVQRGALLYVAEHQIRLMIGYWEWIDEHRAFFFECWKEDDFGGHVIEFGEVKVVTPDAVEFTGRRSKKLAYHLESIASTRDENTVGYKESFNKWREEKAPRMREFIEKVKGMLVTGGE